jgi:hypothetical protein
MEKNMPDDPVVADDDSMLRAALGGLTLHEALIEASLAEKEKAAERAEAAAMNRERALRLLEVLEKSSSARRSS